MYFTAAVGVVVLAKWNVYWPYKWVGKQHCLPIYKTGWFPGALPVVVEGITLAMDDTLLKPSIKSLVNHYYLSPVETNNGSW